MIILGPPEMQREKKALSQPPVRSDEVRGKQFSAHERGYDKTQVESGLALLSGVRVTMRRSSYRYGRDLAALTEQLNAALS